MQSCGFVMANIGLRGAPEALGISMANTWVQPATAANEYDAISGVDAFLDDPLGVPISMFPAGITFPSMKDGEEHVDAAGVGCHTCQILVPAKFEWFDAHFEREAPGAKGSRHAPPHVVRPDQTK